MPGDQFEPHECELSRDRYDCGRFPCLLKSSIARLYQPTGHTSNWVTTEKMAAKKPGTGLAYRSFSRTATPTLLGHSSRSRPSLKKRMSFRHTTTVSFNGPFSTRLAIRMSRWDAGSTPERLVGQMQRGQRKQQGGESEEIDSRGSSFVRWFQSNGRQNPSRL